MKTFSKQWKSSKKPNKQRKYRFNAPLHIRGSLMNVHLSKELRAKHKMRSLRVRVGDKIRIMRGQFKRQEGKVEEVNLNNYKLFISKIEHTKRDGTKARYPIDPSNVMIVELNESKRRLQKAEKSGTSKPEIRAKPVKVAKERPADTADVTPKDKEKKLHDQKLKKNKINA